MKRTLALVLLLACLAPSASADAPASTYAVGTHGLAMAAADFNADGLQDLVVLRAAESWSVGNTASVLLGQPEGGFAAALHSPAGPGLSNGPYSGSIDVLARDLDGDGFPDLVVTLPWQGTSLLRGQGDGTFAAPITLELSPQTPPGLQGSGSTTPGPLAQAHLALALGDVDGDGTLDLVVSGATSYSVVTGYYEYYDEYGYEYYPPVPIVMTTTDGYLNVLPGRADGTFEAGTSVHLGQGRTLQRLALGDFDGDGHLDVTGSPQAWQGHGDGTFTAPPILDDGSTLLNVLEPVADFDGDGALDVLRRVNGSAVAALGNGDGTFRLAEGNAMGWDVGSFYVGDVDGDGKQDRVEMLPATVGYATCVPLGYDYDYDGYDDYECYDPYTTHAARVMRGHGNGTFDLSAVWSLGTFDGQGATGAAVLADLDGDGLPELAACDTLRGVVMVAHNAGGWPAPAPSVRLDDVTVTEGDTGSTSAVFRVRLQAASAQEVSVRYQTMDYYYGYGQGYANVGQDFAAASGTVVFAPGETERTFSVQVLGDRLYEPVPEAIPVTLSNVSPNASIADGWATGWIVDNDPPLALTITDVSKAEGRQGQTTAFVFTLTLSAASVNAVSVPYATYDGTATSPTKRGGTADFTAASGTLLFTPGETTKTITVQVRGDNKAEPQEDFYVVLYSATNVDILDGYAFGTILNDD